MGADGEAHKQSASTQKALWYRHASRVRKLSFRFGKASSAGVAHHHPSAGAQPREAPHSRDPRPAPHPRKQASLHRKARASSRTLFAYENMKPTSESLSLRGRCSSMVVECNCTAVKSCGEKHETKDQPQKSKDLNTLRPGILTSRRRGEIGARAWVLDEVLGMSLAASRYSKHSIKRTCGGCRVCGVGMIGRLHGLSMDSCRAKDAQAASRALIVAAKRVMIVERRRVER
jgi:hypothetical protein